MSLVGQPISVSAPASLCASFRTDVEESIQDEICDTGFYAGIADEAPNETLKLIAWTISRTEFWHAELQQALLASNPPTPSPPPPCPHATGNFVADVTTAIHGELAAITRYAQLAMCAPTITTRLLFLALLLDESSHVGVWTAMLNPV
jgi:rubrerythrin